MADPQLLSVVVHLTRSFEKLFKANKTTIHGEGNECHPEKHDGECLSKGPIHRDLNFALDQHRNRNIIGSIHQCRCDVKPDGDDEGQQNTTSKARQDQRQINAGKCIKRIATQPQRRADQMLVDAAHHRQQGQNHQWQQNIDHADNDTGLIIKKISITKTKQRQALIYQPFTPKHTIQA